MSTNGRLPAAGLTSVQGAIQLADPTAVAWKRLVAATRKELGRSIRIAEPAGGYRTFAVQAAMRQVSLNGTYLQKKQWGLSSLSTAVLAMAGSSPHGDGLCVDIVGSQMDSRFLALAKRYGFARTIKGDPNHFQHDGRTAVSDVPPIDFRALGRYLNGRNLGRHTSTEDDGRPGENLWWLLQKAGRADGLYPAPQYRIDGDPGQHGSKTRDLAHHYWEQIR